MSIHIQHVFKKFGNFSALRDIDLEIKTGELVALLGPSGCGKTTLLRIIAGLEIADSGQIYFHGDDAAGKKVTDRGVGFVFQHYALFRHMTVFDNIAFGLQVKPAATRLSSAAICDKVQELIKLIRLEGMASRYPAQLSGGQRQRVALARALAIEPRALLLDEPFGSLDAKVRRELRQWIRDLHDKLHMTSLFVTHDQEEALEVADRVVVMNAGKIEQIGTPEEVYHHPANPFVYDFLGNVNFFHGRLEGDKVYVGNSGAALDLQGASHVAGGPATAGKPFAKVYIRPHLLELSRKPGANAFKAKVQSFNSAGPFVRVEVLSEWGDAVRVELTQEKFQALKPQKDEEVYVTFKDAKVFSSDDYAI